jgi:uncharacterized membrane protein
MTLHQAASVSADSPGFATTFLLFAYIAYLAFDAKLKVVTTRQWIFAMALLLFASLCKFNLWLVLLLLLIPSARVGTMKKKLATISAITGLLLLVSTLWQAVNRENLAAFALERNAHDIYPQDNFAFVVQQPLEFARALFRTWRILSLNYADNFVGTLGWLTISLPRWLVWSWVGMLLTTALAAAEVRLTAAQRAVCLVVAGGSALSVFLLLWTMQMRRADFVELGMNSGVIPGVQGRYFIPVAPVLLLAISSGRRRLKPSVAVTCCAAMVLLAAAVSLTLVWQAYY